MGINLRPKYEVRITAGRFSVGDHSGFPDSVDLRSKDTPVKDQGQLGSCTGNAYASLREFLAVNVEGRSYEALSRLFIYFEERSKEHTVNEDAGAEMVDGAFVLATYGVCPEVLDPYDIAKFRQAPSAAAIKEAVGYKAKGTKQITDLAGLMGSLAGGVPVCIGIPVYESFESARVASTGVVRMPKAGERLLGGHAVKVVGYTTVYTKAGKLSLSKSRVLVKNSWGVNWGMAGYFTLPFAYLTKYDLDAYTVEV